MQQLLMAGKKAFLKGIAGALGLVVVFGLGERRAWGQVGTSPAKKEPVMTKARHQQMKPTPPIGQGTLKAPRYLGPPITLPPVRQPISKQARRYWDPPITVLPGDAPRLKGRRTNPYTNLWPMTNPHRIPVDIPPRPKPLPKPPILIPNPVPSPGGMFGLQGGGACGFQGGGISFGGFGFGGFGGGFSGFQGGGGGGMPVYGGSQGGLGLGGLGALGGLGGNSAGNGLNNPLVAIAEGMVMANRPPKGSAPPTTGPKDGGGSPDSPPPTTIPGSVGENLPPTDVPTADNSPDGGSDGVDYEVSPTDDPAQDYPPPYQEPPPPPDLVTQLEDNIKSILDNTDWRQLADDAKTIAKDAFQLTVGGFAMIYGGAPAKAGGLGADTFGLDQTLSDVDKILNEAKQDPAKRPFSKWK